MERIALGFGRMSAQQFDRMTPREVQWRIEADQDRENREFERLAQLACWVMNPWLGKEKYSVRKLLKRRVASTGNEETDWEAWAKD